MIIYVLIQKSVCTGAVGISSTCMLCERRKKTVIIATVRMEVVAISCIFLIYGSSKKLITGKYLFIGGKVINTYCLKQHFDSVIVLSTCILY